MEIHDLENNLLFVYDRWDTKSNTPYINLTNNKISDDCFENIQEFFDFYERYYKEAFGSKLKFNFHNYNLSDIEKYPHKNFLYPIKTRNAINELSDLQESVIKKLKKFSNFKLLIVKEHECISTIEESKFYEFLSNKNIQKSSVVILSNTLLNNSSDINYINLNLVAKTSSSIFSHFDEKFIENKSGKFFLSHNHTSKRHRLLLLAFLDFYDILKDTNYSYICKNKNLNLNNLYDEHLILDKSELFFLAERILKINNSSPKYSEYELNCNYYKDDGSVDNSNFKNLDGLAGVSGGLLTLEVPKTLQESYVNIVTESLFEDCNKVHITEKSIRPFYFNQIPIILASKHHIKNMREKFGFDFFDDIIDHSYDNISSDKERFYSIIKEIRRLFNNRQEIINFYRDNKKRFEKNREIVKKIPYIKDDFNSLQKLCKN